MREEEGLKVFTFFDFMEIEMLLWSKYQVVGSCIYTFLSNKAVGYLRDSVDFKDMLGVGVGDIFGIAIDDNVRKSRGYSQNAIFLNSFKKIGIKPSFGSLLAQNNVQYAGKSLEFRQNNPRNFIYKPPQKHSISYIILFDDIITTGTTLKEARATIDSYGDNVVCAFCLSDVREH